MSEVPRFIVLRDAGAAASVPLDTGETASASGSVGEADRLTLRLTPREPGEEYQIRIGNLTPEAPLGWDADRDPSFGLDLGDEIRWPAASYLESARGPTVVELRSRSAQRESDWRLRARIELTVRPSKLGEVRYQAMFNDLRSLSAGLVFDLVSKSSRAYHFVHSPGQVYTGSRQLELRAIEQTWMALLPFLYQIAEQPSTRLLRSPEMRRCWGGERMTPSAVRYLVANGVAPRSSATPRPFTAPVERLSESSCTPEHAVLAGFLDLLCERLRACGRSARAHLASLSGGTGEEGEAISRWADINRPRTERLREVLRGAERLDGQIRRVRRWPLFAGVRPALQPLRTPVFDNVPAYSRARNEILTFLNRAGVVLDEGAGDLIKPTWRMYEQWVLIQVLTALRDAGLRGDPADQLIRQTGRARFTLDFDAGTDFLYHAADGRVIRVRYDPWIFPRAAARKMRETVYRRGGGAEWRPDVLIEVLPHVPTPDSIPDVEYAVVIDAKYSEHLREEQWEGTRKYLDIHGTAQQIPVVRQVWLAHPGVHNRIYSRDPGIHWYSDGPDVGRGENLHGALELLPDEEAAVEGPAEVPTCPLPVMRTFVRGLLAYLGFREGTDVSDAAVARVA